jgi:hypothetical protein
VTPLMSLKPPLAIVLIAAGMGLMAISPSVAQQPLGPPGVQSQAFPNPPAGPLPPPNLGTLTTPSSLAATGVVTGSSAPGSVVPVPGSSYGLAFGTVGRGLPGMQGPLNAPMGAQAPSSFMNPIVIAPLFCDPAVEIPCY